MKKNRLIFGSLAILLVVAMAEIAGAGEIDCPTRLKAGQLFEAAGSKIQYSEPGSYVFEMTLVDDTGNNYQKECSVDIGNPDLNGQIKIAQIHAASSSLDPEGGPGSNWIKLFNTGDASVDLAGWVFYDNQDNELFVTSNTLEEQGLIISSQGVKTVYFEDDLDFSLGSGGGRMSLFSGPREMSGRLQDEIEYPKISKGENYEVIDLPGGGDDTDASGDDPSDIDNGESNEGREEEGDSPVYLQETESGADEEVSYRIPEDTRGGAKNKANESDSGGGKSDSQNNEGDPENRINKSGGEEQTESTRNENTNNRAGLSGSIDGSSVSGNSVSDAAESSSNSAFTASTKMDKSPFGWLYQLWGNWFVWRIILPWLALWLFLYLLVYFLRKALKMD